MSKLFSALMVAIVACAFVSSAMAAPKGGEKKPAKSPEEMFKALDKDGDGSISKDEFIGKAKPEQKEAKEKAFANKDKNGDGKLSKEEFCAAPAKKGKKK